jgi:tellurium resistance protein TerZ
VVSLSKGQAVSLEKAGSTLIRAVMGLGWDVRQAKGLSRMFGGGGGDAIDLDASCLLFDQGRRLVDTVWFGQLKSRGGAIVHTGDNLTGEGDGDDEQIRVDITALPAEAISLVFTVSSFRGDTFDRIENAYCRLIDAASGAEMARYALSGGGSHTGQVMAKLSRTGAGWEMKAIGEPTRGRTVQDLVPAVSAHL